jgi:exopolysaccharide biosynthesis polyprenyl glycosylphosphotransferase
VLLLSFTFFFRFIQTANTRRNFKNKEWTFNTLIVGTGENAKRIAEEISKTSLFNTVIGFVKVESFEKDVAPGLILGNIFDVGKLIENKNVSEVVVALDDPQEHRIFEVINRLFQYNVDIWFTPRLYEILTGKVKIQKYGINPLVSVTQPTMSDWELCMKRTMDIAVSIFGLVLLSPLMLYFSIIIKTDSKGPVFYRQERIGRFGKGFSMLKFRTMYSNSENGTPQLSSPEDERITKVGRTLRKYRLDEIPQFFNIIKGDMSLVGPRPERKFYIDQIVQKAPYYCLIYRIRPGLTSWGPIKIGYADSVDKMIERLNYDIVYMENMNLVTDAKIIFSTLEILFKGKGM